MATTVTPTTHTSQPKTDVVLPLDAPVAEVTSTRPSAEDRIISGIDLLDFGAGGLLPHRLYLVRGGSGVGKSLLGLQYLTRGLELQEPGVLITDQRAAAVMAQAHAIGFAVTESVRRGQLSILNPSGRYFDLVESPSDIMAIIEELGDYIRRMGARRLVIDPVFALINTSYSSHFALSITQSLINALEDLPITTVVTAPSEPSPELTPVLHQLEQNAFGVIDLAQDASTGGRLMRLSKLRYANTEHLAAHYRILNGRGLINYRGEGEQVADITQPWEQSNETSRSVLLLGATPETITRVRDALGTEFRLDVDPDLHTGVERAKREKPGLVLVAPSRSVAAVTAILDLARNAPSSVAFLSPAGNRQSDRVLYLRAGADDFIAEPFTPAELRARAEALIRRSGRRLELRDDSIARITPEELTALMNAGEGAPKRKKSVLRTSPSGVSFDPDFQDRLQRSIDTVAKLDQPFALYWIKAEQKDPELNRSLAKLCRQEDIVCHNRGGEFVAILTGTDESGIEGFETRLREKIGGRLEQQRARFGYSLYEPGQTTPRS